MDEQRLIHLEQTVGDIRVHVGQLSEQLKAHSDASRASQVALMEHITTLQPTVQKLQERSWRQHGATTVLGALGGIAASAAIAALRLIK